RGLRLDRSALHRQDRAPRRDALRAGDGWAGAARRARDAERELLSDDPRGERRAGHGGVRVMGEPGAPELVKLDDLQAGSVLTGRKHILSLLVENQPGVLARIAGLFSRRGFNIDTLAVG